MGQCGHCPGLGRQALLCESRYACARRRRRHRRSTHHAAVLECGTPDRDRPHRDRGPLDDPRHTPGNLRDVVRGRCGAHQSRVARRGRAGGIRFPPRRELQFDAAQPGWRRAGELCPGSARAASGLGSASNTSASAIAPFVCTGRLWIPRVTGGAIRVRTPFPIASLYRQ